MNNGKTHAFFTWAHSSALVPPPVPLVLPEPKDNYTVPLDSSGLTPPWHRLYATDDKIRRGPAPVDLAPHDPVPAVQPQSSRRSFSSRFPRHLSASPNLFLRSPHDHLFTAPSNDWVRPDFVVKADDDSFVMLAELEARLRWELYEAKRDADLEKGPKDRDDHHSTTRSSTTDAGHTARSQSQSASETGAESTTIEPSSTLDVTKREFPEGMVLNRRDWSDGKGKNTIEGPLIYWGCKLIHFIPRTNTQGPFFRPCQVAFHGRRIIRALFAVGRICCHLSSAQGHDQGCRG